MKAAQINAYGDVSNIKVQEADKPVVGEGQVLVKVNAGGLNPFDGMVLAGYVVPADQTKFPLTLGQDFAGVVEAVGDGVSDFAIGDRVYGSSNALFGGTGGFAEFALANVASIAKSPDVSDSEAAALPTAGVSALQAIEAMDLAEGQSLFVDGAAGGVGAFGVQIAKANGVRVVALASTENQEFVKSLGADELIDYKTTNYHDAVKDVDAVLHTVRALDGNEMLSVLVKGGKAVALTDDFSEEQANELNVTVFNQQTHTNSERLATLASLVNDGKVKVNIDTEFSLDDTAKAFDAQNNKSVAGKIVIKL